jgi:hypothetical protein
MVNFPFFYRPMGDFPPNFIKINDLHASYVVSNAAFHASNTPFNT